MNDFPPADQLTTSEVETQPFSRPAEEAILGAVLINPEMYYDLSEIIDADDFYIVRHRWIWQAFDRLQEKRTSD